MNTKLGYSKKIFSIALGLVLLTTACVRSATNTDEEIVSLATEKSAETADAEVQLTLEALLGSATVEATNTPEATATPQATQTQAEFTATVEGAQLTELAAALTEAAGSSDAEAESTATPEGENTATPTVTPTANPTSTACYAARYVYDETYPDGTRVDPGQKIQKTWRLQNVGTCDWVGGQYEMVFVNGERMGGQSPLTINITVPAGGYANFSINMTAPSDPGSHRGEWMLRTKGGDTFGVTSENGINDLPIWIDIDVRG